MILLLDCGKKSGWYLGKDGNQRKSYQIYLGQNNKRRKEKRTKKVRMEMDTNEMKMTKD